VAFGGIFVWATSCQDKTIGREINTRAKILVHIITINIVTYFAPTSRSKVVNPNVAIICGCAARAIVIGCSYCHYSSLIRNRDTISTFIANVFADNIQTNLRPTGTSPLVNSRVSVIGSTDRIIKMCSNSNF
jgi:hypothetical protein